jgi:CubicO group peptidase (beta-lactamase class C family)
LIDSFCVLPLDFVPGSKFQYSNSNYFLLAYIIEQVSGKPYKDYMAENIFGPAGLTNTRYDSPTEIIPGRINGYARYGGKYYNADYISMSQVYGAGALVSNVDDMLKWHNAIYGSKLVKQETLKRAFTPYKLSDGSNSIYGYGWFIKKRDNDESIEHAGGIDGFQSDEIYFPKQDIFLATLYNSLNEGGDNASFMSLDNAIATLAIGKDLPHEVILDSASLAQYMGIYQTDPKHDAIVTLDSGQLYLETPAGGLPKSPLFAKRIDVFFLKIIEAEVEFTRDKSGKVVQAIFRYNGKEEHAKKIK